MTIFNGTPRPASRIPAVLEDIEKIWKDYPDLRLGQLILNAVNEDLLYNAEDNYILDRMRTVYDNRS